MKCRQLTGDEEGVLLLTVHSLFELRQPLLFIATRKEIFILSSNHSRTAGTKRSNLVFKMLINGTSYSKSNLSNISEVGEFLKRVFLIRSEIQIEITCKNVTS